MERRDFVAATASAALAATFRIPRPAGSPLGHSAFRTRLSSIGLELYTVRNLMKDDVEGTLAKVAAVGYREVEFAGYFNHPPADIRAVIDRHGLTAPSAHVPFDAIAQGWDAVIDACHTIGHQWAIVAWIPEERRKTADDWKKIADHFNTAGAACQRAGLRFGYHNHDLEFKPVEGRLPFDLLLENTDRALVDFEVDLFWITFGGADPLAYFAKYPGRFPLVHVKDMAPKPRPGIPPDSVMRDVGKGSIDWKRIFARSQQAGIQHYIVEHDSPGDAIASITASYEYLKNLDY